jgi:arsenate reductase
MAEAIVTANLNNKWKAFSAGTKPTGYVHPLALKVLEEIGIIHQGQSKDTSPFREQDFDLIVTVCDSAAEDCPVWLKSRKQVHLSFVDPAKFQGDDEYVLDKFRQVRDEIKQEIPRILEKI